MAVGVEGHSVLVDGGIGGHGHIACRHGEGELLIGGSISSCPILPGVASRNCGIHRDGLPILVGTPTGNTGYAGALIQGKGVGVSGVVQIYLSGAICQNGGGSNHRAACLAFLVSEAGNRLRKVCNSK